MESISEFHCSPEYHLARLPAFAGILYPFALRLSKSSRVFHASAEELAKYFDVHRATIRRAAEALEKLDFFSLVRRETFHPTAYRVLSHTEWAVKHPGCCVEKIQIPGSGEHDPLGVRLHNVSGGMIHYRPFQLKALRNTDHSEDNIVLALEHFLKRKTAKIRWSGVHLQFLEELRATPPDSRLAMDAASL